MDKFVTLLHNTRTEQKSQAAQHTATHTYAAAHTEVTSCTAHTNAASAQHTHTLHTVTQQFIRKPNTHTHTRCQPQLHKSQLNYQTTKETQTSNN